MKGRGKFLLTCVAWAMALGPMSLHARAQEPQESSEPKQQSQESLESKRSPESLESQEPQEPVTVKAEPKKADPIPFWWFHGELDVGGRFFVNNPQRDGLNYLRQDSL